MRDTLCWNCANYKNCSWFKDFTPVIGWTAKPTKIKNRKSTVNSFLVEKCPNFKADSYSLGIRQLLKLLGISHVKYAQAKNKIGFLRDCVKESGLNISFSVSTKHDRVTNIILRADDEGDENGLLLS